MTEKMMLEKELAELKAREKKIKKRLKEIEAEEAQPEEELPNLAVVFHEGGEEAVRQLLQPMTDEDLKRIGKRNWYKASEMRKKHDALVDYLTRSVKLRATQGDVFRHYTG